MDKKGIVTAFLLAAGLLGTPNAVSYTHLDVYKRQDLNCIFHTAKLWIKFHTAKKICRVLTKTA